ncbi:hypothetical protein Q5741_09245 [Paenibacillus sp. JX-17]|uniref:Polymer-forming cytoskeletal protein n=1 Tax=Paenibacillus lacisoli TaxID=3064525 RepID=A0ABT9CBG3_9BACL|nr:hypothetical protein [Paenibacillus sp. JX-17]MDO7906605.1 hypothetical protein [Paenibacillus sp. JX-17]
MEILNSGSSKSGAERPDLRLIGDSESAGGVMGEVKLTGDGIIHGSLDCLKLSCTGDIIIHGDLIADSVRMMGEMQIEGTARVQSLKITGDTEIHRSLSAEQMAVIGECSIGGDLQVEDLKMTGQLQVKGNCQAEQFAVRGAVNMNEMLNSDVVEIKLHGMSRIREIGGRSIRVERKQGFPLVILNGGKSWLSADQIEGDEISLEYTEAQVVRGSNVVIGSGCRIGLVEYTGECICSPKAEVGELRKI